MELVGLQDFSLSLLDERQVTSMVPTLVLNPAGGKIESPKVWNQRAMPILIFFLTISLMFSLSGSEPYEYMQYAVQWEPAVCSRPYPYKKPCTRPHQQDVTIHGLWPSNFSGAHVTCRQGRAFDINKLHPIQTQLDNCWPSMLSDDDQFWKHEWTKHGRCSFYAFSQLEYFKQAVTLCSRYNQRIGSVLRRARIYPSNLQRVNSSVIANKIHSAIRRRPVLKCADVSLPYPHGHPKLVEIRLCLDVKGKVLGDCPETMVTNCPPLIFLSQ